MLLIAAIDPFYGGITVAVIGLVGAWLERRHAGRMAVLEQKNDEQHARGYGLLESIDRRTQRIDEKVGRQAEWIARHEEMHARS